MLVEALETDMGTMKFEEKGDWVTLTVGDRQVRLDNTMSPLKVARALERFTDLITGTTQSHIDALERLASHLRESIGS